MRFFGLLSLKSGYGGYEDTVALRNSHDKKFPVGIGFGGRVFCCDNLSFIADHIIRRKFSSCHNCIYHFFSTTHFNIPAKRHGCQASADCAQSPFF